MNVIEIYSKEDCSLCDKAKAILTQLQKEFTFELQEVKLTESHPLFPEYKNSFPVIKAPNGSRLSGKLSEDQLRGLLLSLEPPPRIYYVAKFLEALGLVAVVFGFFYGLMGDMWADLYLFLAGMAIFGVGWGVEKWEVKRRKQNTGNPTS